MFGSGKMLVSFLVLETHDGTKLTKFAPVAARRSNDWSLADEPNALLENVRIAPPRSHEFMSARTGLLILPKARTSRIPASTIVRLFIGYLPRLTSRKNSTHSRISGGYGATVVPLSEGGVS